MQFIDGLADAEPGLFFLHIPACAVYAETAACKFQNPGNQRFHFYFFLFKWPAPKGGYIGLTFDAERFRYAGTVSRIGFGAVGDVTQLDLARSIAY